MVASGHCGAWWTAAMTRRRQSQHPASVAHLTASPTEPWIAQELAGSEDVNRARLAQASLTLRPAGLLSHPRWPLSQGSDPARYQTKPLAS
jgi:hypothetical protein